LTHEEFMTLYDDSLKHGWVTSKISSIAAKQKQREKEYNQQYYQKHSRRWRELYAYSREKLKDKYDYSNKENPNNEYYKRTASDISRLKDSQADSMADLAVEYLFGGYANAIVDADTNRELANKSFREYDKLHAKYSSPSYKGSIAKDVEAARQREMHQLARNAQQKVKNGGDFIDKLYTFGDSLDMSIRKASRKTKRSLQKASAFLSKLFK